MFCVLLHVVIFQVWVFRLLSFCAVAATFLTQTNCLHCDTIQPLNLPASVCPTKNQVTDSTFPKQTKLNDQHWYVSHPSGSRDSSITFPRVKWLRLKRISGLLFIKQTFGNLRQWRLPYGKVLLINHKSITRSLFYYIFFQNVNK